MPRSTKFQLSGFISVIVFTVLANSSTFAQDEATRYRPQGRELAREVGRQYGQQLFEARSYDAQPDVAEFSNATVFYPLTLSFAPPSGAVILIPGFRGTQANYDWWGPMLASLGVVTMIIDTNDPTDNLAARADALVAAAAFLKSENDNSESPISGKVDTSKLAIMGHSLGGGGSLHAAMELASNIKAVIPLLPYCCELGQSFDGDFSGLAVPTLIIASAEDTIAPPAEHAKALYDAVPASTPKAYVEFAAGDHGMPTNGGSDLLNIGRYAYTWLQLQFEGGANFAAVFNGDAGDELSSLESSL
ncbi:MAG: hypothetical protein DHS20C12_28140 [Pseudohongiella sp.]|nr:MAG: hypothetical protein DHS20C12_28140 [Pseudohongiella sp.]